MKTMLLDEFRVACMAQEVAGPEDVALICPMCDTIQTARDLIAAGAGKTYADVEGLIGFSCIGRYTHNLPPSKTEKGKGCNWTLGGLFRTHKLEVITPDGERHPRFELATPEQAKAHANAAFNELAKASIARAEGDIDLAEGQYGVAVSSIEPPVEFPVYAHEEVTELLVADIEFDAALEAFNALYSVGTHTRSARVPKHNDPAIITYQRARLRRMTAMAALASHVVAP